MAANAPLPEVEVLDTRAAPPRNRLLPTWPWIVAVVLAAVGASGLLLLVRIPRAPVSPPAALGPGEPTGRVGAPTLGLARLNPPGREGVIEAEAALLDPTPLFLPTKLNAGSDVGPPPLQASPRGTFQRFPPKLTYPEGVVAFSFPSQRPELAPVDVLRIGSQPEIGAVLGRREVPMPPLSPRWAVVEVVRTQGGEVLLQQPLGSPGAPVPPDWRPLEVLVGIDAAGVVGSATLAEGSGVEEWDAYVLTYLTGPFRLGQRLSPGFYRVRVGP